MQETPSDVITPIATSGFHGARSLVAANSPSSAPSARATGIATGTPPRESAMTRGKSRARLCTTAASASPAWARLQYSMMILCGARRTSISHAAALPARRRASFVRRERPGSARGHELLQELCLIDERRHAGAPLRPEQPGAGPCGAEREDHRGARTVVECVVVDANPGDRILRVLREQPSDGVDRRESGVGGDLGPSLADAIGADRRGGA